MKDAFPGDREIREAFRDRLVPPAAIPALPYRILLSSSIFTLFALGRIFVNAIMRPSVLHLFPRC